MKKIILSMLLVATAFSSSRAALITQNSTQSLTTASSNFTFNQFNSALGSLTAVDLIVQSSTLQGNFSLSRTSGTRIFTDINAQLSLDNDATLGFAGYDSTPLSFGRSPSGSFTLNATNTTRNFSVNGTTQSLIGGSPVSLSMSNGSLSSYIGIGNISFASLVLMGDNNSGSGVYASNYSNILSPTTLSLVYTYSAPGTSPVPEPRQVASSLLVVSGLGIYFLRRRKLQAAS